jgi:hypothetical protein
MQIGVVHAPGHDPHKHFLGGRRAARASVSISNGADRTGTTAAVIFIWRSSTLSKIPSRIAKRGGERP